MGNAYFKLGDFDNSIKFLEKSLSEHRVPDVLQKLREVEKAKKEFSEQSYYSIEESDIAREKGNELFKAHDYIGAVKFYSDAIKRNKNDPKNFSNRAACYLKLMALPEADRDCDAAISIDKNFVKAYIRKAAILHAKREFMKSIDVCNEAKAIDVEHKHTDELDNQIQKCYYGLNQVQNSEDKAETLKRAENDPEVIKIMQDPVMQQILQQMQADPKAARDHMRNPIIAEKLKVLINAGILRTG